MTILNNIKDDKGNTLLHCAVVANSLEFVKLLIENGINIDAENNKKWTPLHEAVFNANENDESSMDIVKLLVNSGSDVKKKNNKDQKPYDIAVANGCETIAEYLKFVLNMQLTQKIRNEEPETNEPHPLMNKGIEDFEFNWEL